MEARKLEERKKKEPDKRVKTGANQMQNLFKRCGLLDFSRALPNVQRERSFDFSSE